jgi:hypothetical protein
MDQYDLLKEVEKDSIISDNLVLESVKIPSLHGKYIYFLLEERRIQNKLKAELELTRSFKFEYYSGRASAEELKKRGLKQFGSTILKSQIVDYVNMDKDIVELQYKIEEQNIKIDYLDSFVRMLNNRHWIFRNVIEWSKFKAGEN